MTLQEKGERLAKLMLQLEQEEADAHEAAKAMRERLTKLRVEISELAHDVAAGQPDLPLDESKRKKK